MTTYTSEQVKVYRDIFFDMVSYSKECQVSKGRMNKIKTIIEKAKTEIPTELKNTTFKFYLSNLEKIVKNRLFH